jgi:hypothetical protein
MEPKTNGSSGLLWLVAVGVAAVLAVALAFGCVKAPTCPEGSYPVKAAAKMTTHGGAGVDVPGMDGKGDWGTEAVSKLRCRPVCPKGWAWGPDGGCVTAALPEGARDGGAAQSKDAPP